MTNIITLNADSLPIVYLCKKDKRLSKVISMVGEISYKPYDDGFAFLVHEIIEQMLSIKSGAKIYGRLKEICNGDISPLTIDKLSDEELRAIGTSNSKANCIRSITNILLNDETYLEKLEQLSDLDVRKQLMTIKGIGQWTSDMYLIFVLDRQDILPIGDAAFLQSYKWIYKDKDCSVDKIKKKCQKWKPYSSIASRYLYKALDMGLTKEEFHLFKK